MIDVSVLILKTRERCIRLGMKNTNTFTCVCIASKNIFTFFSDLDIIMKTVMIMNCYLLLFSIIILLLLHLCVLKMLIECNVTLFSILESAFISYMLHFIIVIIKHTHTTHVILNQSVNQSSKAYRNLMK